MASIPATPLLSRPPSGGLALAFQEPITVILRLGKAENRELRADFLTMLQVSEHDAKQAGYGEHEIAQAKFAVTVFLDEAVLKSQNPALTGWDQVQFELYQRSDGGEVFFHKLRALLNQGNTSDAADLLEVYDLCLLLGFQGGQDERAINALTTEIMNKIVKIRRGLVPSRPSWALPDEPIPEPRADRWIRPLLAVAAISFLVCAALLTTFNMLLNSGAEEIRLDRTQIVR